MPEWRTKFKNIEVGTGRELKSGEDIAILSIGHVGNYALDAAKALEEDGLNVGVYDMRFVKPLDEKLLTKIFSNYKYLVTVEDGCIIGGFGSAVLEFMASNDFSAKVKILGIPDRIVEHGTQEELHAECNYDSNAIIEAVKQFTEHTVSV
jgi:1-deoxy-D-xylulose-5-phosphate synthase